MIIGGWLAKFQHEVEFYLSSTDLLKNIYDIRTEQWKIFHCEAA
jgi:hypothetical protein